MAEELKRVGLVFKADGSVDFTKSLKEVNASIQENRSAFKLAQAQWDSNTKSADKLKDRQKYLAEQTKDYGDKVKMLERQLEDLENAEEKDEAAIQKKKNQLNNTKAALKNYEKGLKEVSDALSHGKASMEEYAKKIENVGNKAGAVGKEMTKKVTAPLVAMGGLAIKSAMELDEGYDTIIQKTGATGEQLQNLTDIADNVFNSMPVEMEEVGVAIGEVNTRFHITGDELKKVSQDFLQFAEINKTDLNSSIDGVSATMTKFGIDSSQTRNVLGLLTKAGQDTGVSMEALEKNLQTNGSTLKEMDLDLVSSVNLLAQFESSGVDSATALAGLKKAQQNATKEGKTLKDALGETISGMKNAETETEALQIATELFGKKGAAEMTQAVREGRFSLDNLSGSLENYSGIVQNTYNETIDPWDKMRVATNQLKTAGSDLAAQLFEVLAPIIESVTKKIEEFTSWYSNLDDKQKKTITTIGLLAASIGPLLMMFNKGCQGISNIIGFTSKATSLFNKMPGVFSTVGNGAKVLWGVMAAHPFGAIVTVIGLLITAFVTAYNKCEWFRDGVNRIFGGVVNFLKNTVSKIKGFFNFKWSLPHIELPHFSISGKFSLKPPSVPKLHVKWYAKAMNQAYMLKGASIFGQSNGNLLGGGEVGNEMIMGEQYMIDMIRKASGNNEELIQTMKDFEKRLFDLLLRFFPEFINDKVVISDREFKRTLTEMGVVFQ